MFTLKGSRKLLQIAGSFQTMTDVGETLQYAAVIDYFSFVKRTRPRWNCPSSGFNSIWFSSVRFRMAVFRACHVYSSYISLHVLETIARSGLVALCVGVFSTNRGRNSLIPWPKRGREMRNGLLQFCHGNIDASENPVKQHLRIRSSRKDLSTCVLCACVFTEFSRRGIKRGWFCTSLLREKYDRICLFGLKGCDNTSSSSRKMICNCRNITQSTIPKRNQRHPPNLL